MKKKGNTALNALGSLKLTVALILFIAVLCVVGSVFPQESSVTSSGHGDGFRIPFLLGPYDVFHSVWFLGAGLLLCINLALCMMRRLKPKKRSLLMLLLHSGVLLVIIGYAIGFMGLDGYAEIPEGESVSQVVLKDGSVYDPGFSIRCERFAVDFYGNGMPREYTSDLSFLINGQVADRARVRVNHPASFAGISFYQESFRDLLSAVLTVSDGKQPATFTVSEGDIIPLPSAGTRARVVKIWHDLMHAGPAVKLLIEEGHGGWFVYVFRDIDVIISKMPGLLEAMPAFDPSGFHPYTFSCSEVKHSFATGIGVKRDPGAPLAGIGGAIFFLGILLACFLPPSSGPGRERAPVQEAAHGPVRAAAKSKES